MAHKAMQKAQAYFAKIKALNAAIDGECAYTKQGARKAKRKLCDSWIKRNSNNVTGFWNTKEARRVS